MSLGYACQEAAQGSVAAEMPIDPEREAERIERFIREQTLSRYKRRGVVVGLSGGVDSALMAALCTRALGAERLLGVILPEKDSSPQSRPLAEQQARALGIAFEVIDLTDALTTLGAYRRRDEVIAGLDPDYRPERDRAKLSLPPNLLANGMLNVFTLTVIRPTGRKLAFRLDADRLNAILAAQNMKQRTRMMHLYYEAEKRHYVVGGTTNRTELEQGFFVKYGDGGVDLEPIAHLYKTQVFQLARHVGVIEPIIQRSPSPDTWSAGVSDEEYYFRMPFATLDWLMYAWDLKVDIREVSEVLHLTEDEVKRAFRDFESKKRTTWHLRCMPPSLLD